MTVGSFEMLGELEAAFEDEALELELFDPPGRNPGLPTLPPPAIPPVPMPNPDVPPPALSPSCPGLGTPPVPLFECPDSVLARITTDAGMPMNRAAVLTDIQRHIRVAACVASDMATRLGARDPRLVAEFSEAFGQPIDTPWRPGGWSHGRVVQQRFLGARRLLVSGDVLYSCWGRPRRAGGPETDPDYLALASPGEYWIALGRRYWKARDINLKTFAMDTRTFAILLAALRAYYGPLLSDATPTARVIRNINCYLRFAKRLLNWPNPQWVEDGCPSGGLA